jgi:hypothetical protein
MDQQENFQTGERRTVANWGESATVRHYPEWARLEEAESSTATAASRSGSARNPKIGSGYEHASPETEAKREIQGGHYGERQIHEAI